MSGGGGSGKGGSFDEAKVGGGSAGVEGVEDVAGIDGALVATAGAGRGANGLTLAEFFTSPCA